MRNEFFKLFKEEMRRDPSAFFIVADMGLGLVEPFQQDFPDRYLNTGICEQNMIGMAAGLYNAGFRPFCYTIANFITERSFEQIRNDVCLHKYPITIIGNSTGFDNGLLGPTHQVIDDIGCMKILPELSIYSPTSLTATRLVFAEVIAKRRPAYIRIGKGSCDAKPLESSLNHMVIRNSSDILVITHGAMMENCLKAANLCNKFSLFAVNRIKPIDRDELRRLFDQFSKIVVVEDHMVTSGLYNSLCQCLVELQLPGKALLSIATPEIYEDVVGNRDFFADRYGFSPEKIARFISGL